MRKVVWRRGIASAQERRARWAAPPIVSDGKTNPLGRERDCIDQLPILRRQFPAPLQ